MNTSETLEARNKMGSREKKREGGGAVYERQGLSSWLTNKQRLDESRDTGKQLDNGLDCAAVSKVVWETLGPGWEVFSREIERQKEK